MVNLDHLDPHERIVHGTTTHSAPILRTRVQLCGPDSKAVLEAIPNDGVKIDTFDALEEASSEPMHVAKIILVSDAHCFTIHMQKQDSEAGEARLRATDWDGETSAEEDGMETDYECGKVRAYH